MTDQKTEKTYGIHAATAVLKNYDLEVYRVCLTREDERTRALRELCKQRDVPIQTISRESLGKELGHNRHQGVMVEHETGALLQRADVLMHLKSCPEPWLVMVLDGVQDPHNLGACLRCADAAGVHAVLAPADRSASVTSVVRKVSAGAAESVHFFQVTNLVRSLTELKQAGVWVYGATDAVDEPLFRQDLTGSVAIVLGAEGGGIRRLTRDACDGLFSIPMLGSVSSLNVSVAAGVCFYEAVRQRA